MTEPSTLSKSELQAQLEHAKSNYVLGLAAISLFSNQKSIEHLRFSHAAFGKYFVGFEQVADLLGHPPAQTQLLKEFLTMLIRALLKESFEIVGEYARQTSQQTAFEQQPWFHFARLIRNSMSHNFRFQFKQFDRTLLPLEWNSRRITEQMNGHFVPIDFLGYDGVWELFRELETFAIESLK